MNALFQALERLDGREPGDSPAWQIRTVAEPQAVKTFPPADVSADPTASERDEFDAFASALLAVVAPPAVVAFVTCGVSESIIDVLRDLAEAVANRTGDDVVLLGPGALDEPQSPGATRPGLHRPGGFGFVHASADQVGGRLPGLRRVAGVVVVVELGISSKQGLTVLRSILAAGGISLLGTIVLQNR